METAKLTSELPRGVKGQIRAFINGVPSIDDSWKFITPDVALTTFTRLCWLLDENHPNTSKQDGIQIVRSNFHRFKFDVQRCKRGLECLKDKLYINQLVILAVIGLVVAIIAT